MSHLAHHADQPEEAIQLAERGRQALQGGRLRQPELETRLLAMQARGFAALREPGKCTQFLIEAETTLTASHAEEPSPWVSGFDEGALASEAARCVRQLGDLGEAQRQAERIIALRPGGRTRSRAFGQLILVTVLVSQGKPDEACAVAQEVLDATQSLGSYLVIQQLLDLKQLLEFCTEVHTQQRLRPYVWRRVAEALDALKTDRIRYLQDGNPLVHVS